MIKRIGLLMMAALVAAVMMVAMAAPAFADAGGTKGQCKNQQGAKCTQGANEVKINPAKCESDVKGLCQREGREQT